MHWKPLAEGLIFFPISELTILATAGARGVVNFLEPILDPFLLI
jgi:hypothetical protein